MRVLSLLCLIATSTTAFAQTAVSESSAQAYPVVLTPTRLRQSLQDVPASVTVIRGETLRHFGILSIPDALRLVPGMAITQASGGDWRIGYHGTNILTPRRMNVTIDGVSVYQPAFARVDWDHLPVTIEDIDRIEITRGPDSAAYGPNSMLAIVNIITKHPADVEPAMLSVTGGLAGRTSVTGRLGLNIGSTPVRVSVSHDEDGGYDWLSVINGDHDTTRYDRFSLRSQTPLSDSASLDVSAGYVGGVREVPYVNAYQSSSPDQHIEDYYLAGTLTKSFSTMHELQLRASYWRNSVRQTWNTCLPGALLTPEMFDLWRESPTYAAAVLGGRQPSGGTAAADALAATALTALNRLGAQALAPICGIANQDLTESRSDLELQDTLVFSERLRIVSGAGARYQVGDSETFLGGSVGNTIWRAFANIEYKPSDWLTLNGGAYAERDQLTGSTISPRLAANVRLSPYQALRFVWASGSRTPDIQEQRANWTYSFLGSPPLEGQSALRFYQSAQSPGNLRSERITSREMGYLLNIPTLGLMLDAKVFDDHLTDLISEKLQVSSYEPSNTNSLRLAGVEIQANAELSPSWSIFGNYAYLRSYDASTPLEQTQYARNSGALGLTHAFGNGWRWSFAYYAASANGLGESSYGREDLTVSKAFTLGGAQAAASLILRRLDNKTASYFRDFGDTRESQYDNRLQAYGQLRLSF